MSNNSLKPILVTGATGYVGGRLIPQLLQRGFRVRAMSRSIEKLKHRTWATHAQVEIISADVMDKNSLEQALQGCQAAYYLVHSMVAGQKDFAAADRKAASNMVAAAEKTNLNRMIYLSGLGEDDPHLSKHLRSRTEVAKILKAGKVPVTVLRAAMIIGSGSASFEILRYLVDRLPVMITPRWLQTPSQPIAIRNVIEYLIGCIEKEETTGRTFDIGGSDVLTYRKLMEIYAEEAGLPKRLVIPVPVLTPRLSSYWIHLVTPVSATIARPLAEGLRNPVVCQGHTIEEIIPQKLLTPREAIRVAVETTQSGEVQSHWTDAGVIPPVEAVYAGDPKWAGGTVLKDSREILSTMSQEAIWDSLIKIGGRRGWYHANWLWVLRGFLDKLFGGVGLRRGRRDHEDLIPGDALDFWRVLKVEKQRQILLLAEMKLPGSATLEFKLTPSPRGVQVTQTALFKPKGLWGILYWYLMLPFHHYIFSGMLDRIMTQSHQKVSA